jgi:exonuclease SbcD
VDRSVVLKSEEGIADQLRQALLPEKQLENAIVRLVVDYPREWEAMIDEAAVREMAATAFEFHLVKRPQMNVRIRLPEGQLAGSMSSLELLESYWQASHLEPEETNQLKSLAAEIIQGEEPA